MSGDILFAQGDLLEYARPTKGLAGRGGDRHVTVRAVVLGFAVRKDGRTRVWLYEGAEQLGDWSEEGDARTLEGIIDKEREIVIWKADELVEFPGFQVVRRGNHPTELTNFDLAHSMPSNGDSSGSSQESGE